MLSSTLQRAVVVAGASLLASTLLVACNRSKPPDVNTPPGEVVARVADRVVTTDDVDRTLERMLGSAAPLADAGASKKAMDSLVALHAIAAKQEKSMAVDELRELNRRAFHYREELLMQAYVQEHAQDLAVSEDEIRAFYEQHPELFGGAQVRRFETLATVSASDPVAARKLQEVSATAAWDRVAAASAGKLVHARSSSEVPGLSPRVVATLSGLGDGQVSDVLVIDGALLRVKRLAAEPQPARPLPEVRDSVRRMVAARKTRDRIREISESVKAETKVKFVEQGS